MAELAGRPVLAHVIERCKAIRGADFVGLAVPDRADSNGMTELARSMGILPYRGPEHDVLGRYCGAVEWYQNLYNRRIEVVMRITADCPLLDPQICTSVLALRLRQGAAYASNVHPRSFPKGLDCEAVTVEALHEADRLASADEDREHVTPWIVRNARRVNLPSGRFDLKHLRWTLDYPEDLEFLRAVCGFGPAWGMADVLAVLDANPHLSAINASVERSAA